ncbi:hypothetical protein HDE68_004171, partial [Pedobacter cryoconitis]
MVEKENKSKVFLSYAANDRKKIDFLKNGLIENGFSVLSDSLIAPGTNWHKIISYELNASDYLIICLTTKMFADGPFTFDYNKAFVSEAKKRDITIIPILLDDILMPDALKEFVYLDFRKNHSDCNPPFFRTGLGGENSNLYIIFHLSAWSQLRR